MIDDLNLINNIDIFFDNKIILYGAGEYGQKTLEMLRSAGFTVSYFCDSNTEKIGNFIAGTEVISLESLIGLDRAENLIIIITTQNGMYTEQIAEIIQDSNLRTNNIFTLFGLNVLLSQNVNNPRIDAYFRFLRFHTERLKHISNEYRVYKILVDAFIRLINDFNNIVVYQPGKVASNSIVGSLHKLGFSSIHTHYLSDCIVKEMNPQIIRDALKTYPSKLKIITLVREPIERAISALFQYLDDNGTSLIMSMDGSIDKKFSEILTGEIFRKNLIYRRFCQANWFEWFDYELKNVFGVDVFAYSFDQERGYSIIKQDNIEVLVIKLEKLITLESVIGDFVGAPSFKLINANVGSYKPYKYLYQNTKNKLRIPSELLAIHYDNNPKMDHFYSANEKEQFLKKWARNVYPIS